jgi:hypothetical protein
MLVGFVQGVLPIPVTLLLPLTEGKLGPLLDVVPLPPGHVYEDVNVPCTPSQTLTVAWVTVGGVLIITVATACTRPQPFAAAMVLVTVYVPALLVARVISPVFAFKAKPPGVALNVPATPPPLNVGDGLLTASEQ